MQDAVVRREACENDFLGVPFSQDGVQSDWGTAVVLEERGMTVDVRPDTLAYDYGTGRDVRFGVKRGAMRFCDTVVWPQHLIAIGQRDTAEG